MTKKELTPEERLARLEDDVAHMRKTLDRIEDRLVSIAATLSRVDQSATRAAAAMDVVHAVIGEPPEAVEIPEDMRKFFPGGES